MKYQNIIMMLFAMVLISACNENEVFEREQYKHAIALKSEGVFKIFNQVFDFSDVDSEGFANGFIAASVGGSLTTKQPIKLSIVEDKTLFDEYNLYSFATEAYKYALYIPEDRKIIDDYSINIPAGERSGTMNIRIRPIGLSPDSIYMIPFRVSNVSAYEMNQNASTVLYRLQWKNEWSSTASISQYSHVGIGARIDVSNLEPEVKTVIQKHVHPLSANQVRIFAADKGFNAAETTIKNWALILTMDKAGNITITSLDNENGPKVEQIDEPCGGGHVDWKCQICESEAFVDPNDLRTPKSCYYDPYYSNKYAVITDQWNRRYKTFLLCYHYTNPENGQRRIMKEELRIDYRPEIK